MTFLHGTVEITDRARPVCPVGPSGVTVQNLSSQDVTIGGRDVEAGEGIVLEPKEKISFPGGNPKALVIGAVAEGLVLWAVVPSGKGKVAFIRHEHPLF